MKVTHLRKKDVIKSSVKGIDIEFDHERLATILGVHSENGIREYIKEVWEESKYTKPLEITRRVANDETITAARRVKSSEMKPFQRFIYFLVMKNGEEPKKYDFFEDTFLTMCKLTREDGVWWIGSGENRRRDDAPEEEERNKDDFDWEAVIDEATVEGNRARMINFMMLEVGEEEPMMKLNEDQAIRSFIFSSAKRSRTYRSRPLGPH
ncbi:hypothetical protein Dimus_027242 [Dionaea muscipula]